MDQLYVEKFFSSQVVFLGNSMDFQPISTNIGIFRFLTHFQKNIFFLNLSPKHKTFSMVIISQHMDARSAKISEFSDNMFFGNSMSKITFSAKMKKIKILSNKGGLIHFYQSKI